MLDELFTNGICCFGEFYVTRPGGDRLLWVEVHRHHYWQVFRHGAQQAAERLRSCPTTSDRSKPWARLPCGSPTSTP